MRAIVILLVGRALGVVCTVNGLLLESLIIILLVLSSFGIATISGAVVMVKAYP
ncbi:MAG: hypothetical protein RXR51_05870 [Nitrososphaeria archaeon]